MADLVGALVIALGLDSAEFKSGMDKAQKDMRRAERNFQKIGENLSGMGQNLTIGLTAPLVAFGVMSGKAALESRDAAAQVAASLASMGDAAGRTQAQLESLASGIMRNSLYDDDEVLRDVIANMLTFGNIAEGTFDRAAQATVDLATKLKKDLGGATQLVGKALNAPVAGMTALSRAGVQLTDEQKALVQQMVATGDAAGAQNILLTELERQFGGSAKAAENAAGPLHKLREKYDEISETVGSVLLVSLERLAPMIERVADVFLNMSPGMQSFVVGAMAVAAALGPVLMGVGALVQIGAPLLAWVSTFAATAATAGTAGGALSAALTGLSAGGGAIVAALAPALPIVAAVAAAGALLYSQWDKIGPMLSEFAASFEAAIGPRAMALISQISTALSALWAGPFGQGIRAAASTFGTVFVEVNRVLGTVFIATLSAVLDVMSGFVSYLSNGFKMIGALLRGDFAGAGKYAQAALVGMAKGILAALDTMTGGGVSMVIRMVSGIKDWIVGKLNAVWDTVMGKIHDVERAFFGLYDAVVGHSHIPDMVDEIGQHIGRLKGLMVDPVAKMTAEADANFEQFKNSVSGLFDRLFPDEARMRKFNEELARFVVGYEKGAMTAKDYSRAVAALRAELGTDIAGERVAPLINAQELDNARVEITEDMQRIVDAANDNFKTPMAQIFASVVEASSRAASDIAKAIGNLKSAFKDGGFWGIVGGIADVIGVAANAYGNISHAISGARANGGPVSAGKTYLVGERGPELFTPKLNGDVIANHQMGGGGAQTVQVNITDTTGLFKFQVAQTSGAMIAANEQGRAFQARRRIG